MAENINPIGSGFYIPIGTDYEYEQIKRKMFQYGLKPSGSKSRDKARLHEVELREAKKENAVSSKFLTVTKSEQEKIQDKKKQKRIDIDPKKYPETTKGQRLLGEQIMLAIKMKKELEEKYKNKRNEAKKKDKI